MSAPWILAERVTKAPRLASAKTARRAMAEFRAGLSPQNASYPLAELLDRHPHLEALLTGIADHSPYLWRLASTDPARLLRLAASAPEESLAATLEIAVGAGAARLSESEVMRLLRRGKQE